MLHIRKLTIILLLLVIHVSITGAQTKKDFPFGINDAFSSSGEKSSDYLKDLGAGWVSDHFPRGKAEKKAAKRQKRGSYDFDGIADKLREYIVEAGCNAWFIINVDSKFPFKDGREIKWGKSKGKFIPDGPESYRAYGEYLKALVSFVNSRAPGEKAKLWSIDNEHASVFIPAYCESEIELGFENGKKAAMAYADLVEFSSKAIKQLDPAAKIVFGGPGGGTPDEEYGLYYRPALQALKAKDPEGFFDFFDFHNFNVYEKYMENPRGKGLHFFKKMLAEAGFPDKPIIVKAGATHSGMDKTARNKRLQKFQTERDQAEYLVKRFIYHVGEGVQIILWGTVREDEDEHGAYSHNGLVYNGIPKPGKCDSSTILPCPDPGDGIKKLAYHSFKFLSENLNGADFRNVIKENTGASDVFLYRFVKNGKLIYFAWWDYFEGKNSEKEVTFDISQSKANQVEVIDAIPDAESGAALDERNFPKFFKSRVISVNKGRVSLLLSKNPVLIRVSGKD